MNCAGLLAILGSMIVIIGANWVMFLWTHAQSRSDIRHLENKIDEKIDNFIKAIQDETKDFHRKLCTLKTKDK